MLHESKHIHLAVIRYFESIKGQEEFPVRYMILASQTPGVFYLGGDLELFIHLIKNCKRKQLLEYAT